MIDPKHVLQLPEDWRGKAASLRQNYKGMGDLAAGAEGAATVFETCAGNVEELVKQTRGAEAAACAVGQEGGA